MDLGSLKYFVEIATQGGFNRAAANLNVAQSALSRRVAKLEHELGAELFARHRGRIQLTPAGGLLLEKSQSLLRHFEQVRNEMLAQASEPRGELSMGLPPSLGIHSTQLLLRMRDRYPKLVLNVWVATSVDLRSMLVSGKVDLAVFAGGDADPALVITPLYSETLHLVGAIGSVHGLANNWSQIEQMPLVLTARPNSVRLLVEGGALRRKRKLNVVMEVNDILLQMNLAASGNAYAILPASALKSMPSHGIASCPLPGVSLSWVVGHTSGRPPSIATEKALGLIEEIFREA